MNNTKNAIIMVGLPGSGKSTIARLINCCNQYAIMSLDDIIEDYARQANNTYSEVFEKYVALAAKQLENKIESVIIDGKDIIFDQTNLSVCSRYRTIRELYASNRRYNITAIVVTEQESVISERLRIRGELTGKIIPDNVIAGMKSRFEFPSLSEGFNKIIHLDSGLIKIMS